MSLSGRWNKNVRKSVSGPFWLQPRHMGRTGPRRQAPPALPGPSRTTGSVQVICAVKENAGSTSKDGELNVLNPHDPAGLMRGGRTRGAGHATPSQTIDALIWWWWWWTLFRCKKQLLWSRNLHQLTLTKICLMQEELQTRDPQEGPPTGANMCRLWADFLPLAGSAALLWRRSLSAALPPRYATGSVHFNADICCFNTSLCAPPRGGGLKVTLELLGGNWHLSKIICMTKWTFFFNFKNIFYIL